MTALKPMDHCVSWCLRLHLQITFYARDVWGEGSTASMELALLFRQVIHRS